MRTVNLVCEHTEKSFAVDTDEHFHNPQHIFFRATVLTSPLNATSYEDPSIRVRP
jgi:hypothetical protein